MPHHAKRLVKSRLHVLERAILDPIIRLLQRLRKGTGASESPDDEGDEDRPKSRKAKPGGGRDVEEQADEGEGEGETPKPKGRLLAFLIYFNVLLAGGMIGGALAYELLAQLLERQSAESAGLQAAMSKLSKSTGSNEKALQEAQAKRVEAEKKFEEAKKKQVEVEKKLEAALNDAKTLGEKQKKFDEAAKMLDSLRATDRSAGMAGAAGTAGAAGAAGATSAPRLPSAGNSDGKARPLKSGDCPMAAGDVKGLKDCVKDFNR